MYAQRTIFSAIALLFLLTLSPTAGISPVINYQGRMTTIADQPVPDGDYEVVFSIYDVPSGGSPLWTSGLRTITVTEGLFTYQLGSAVSLPNDLFATGVDRYLGITVESDPESIPRTLMTSAPYAYQALRSDTAGFAMAGAGGDGCGWVDDGSTVRLITAEDTTVVGIATPMAKLHVEGDLYVNDKAAIGPGNNNSGYRAFVAGEGNSATGSYSAVMSGSSNTASGDYAAVGGGSDNVAGGDYSYAAGGHGDSAVGPYSFVVGLSNTAGAAFSSVSGGTYNEATGEASNVGGGQHNIAEAAYATIAGGGPSDPGNPTTTNNEVYDDYGAIGGGGGNRVGSDNAIPDDNTYATVSGGEDNVASGSYATVGGGSANSASGYVAAISGGQGNSAAGNYCFTGGGTGNSSSAGASTVTGGSSNTASSNYSFVGGGMSNSATSTFDLVTGGSANEAGGSYSAVGGGGQNSAMGMYSVVSGGNLDTASANYSSIGGGQRNYASGEYARIGGGKLNDATGDHSTIAGGYANTVSGQYSAIPGGSGNEVTGSCSFAAGQRAKALHTGTFVWADISPIDFESTDDMQFIIRAQRGVGINTNAPTTDLEVDGIIYSNSGGFKFPDGTVQTTAYTGARDATGGTGFPAPAYTSGWVDLEPNEMKVLEHNLGGDVYDYVVDVQFKDTNSINSQGSSQDVQPSVSLGGGSYSVGYRNLDSRYVHVYRLSDESNIGQVRVRIWVVK